MKLKEYEYFTNDNGTLYNGDCLDVLKLIPDNSIDLICTDPPYGYSFMGKEWDKAFVSVEIWRECLRVLKDGAFAYVMSAPRLDCQTEMAVRLREAGFVIGFTPIYFSYASGFPKAGNLQKILTKRGDVNADKFAGGFLGFQPKPAVEIIMVVMKPLTEKSYTDQALKNNHGITYLDRCRIPYESEGDKSISNRPNDKSNKPGKNFCSDTMQSITGTRIANPQGRFPANLIVSDDILNDGKVSKSAGGNQLNRGQESRDVYGDYTETKSPCPNGYQDSGSYSRYFSLDSWFEERLKLLPESVRKVFPFLIVPKASKSEKNQGCEGLEEKQKWLKGGTGTGISDRENIMSKNIHPTVKPIALMSYLITLGSNTGETVLDPFCGSGTTCKAADAMGMKYIGIERSKEYCEIGKHRIDSEQQRKLF